MQVVSDGDVSDASHLRRCPARDSWRNPQISIRIQKQKEVPEKATERGFRTLAF